MKDMLGRDEAVTVQKALELLSVTLADRRPTEVDVAIEEALGMVCARDVTAPEDLPGFARSTVDGYAVHSADTFGATETMPSYIELHESEVRMGAAADFGLPRGHACRIPTGGMLPAGSDAVVMFEHAESVDGGMIEVLRAVVPGENVIRQDEDVRKGETVIRRGRRLRPHDLSACAAIGAVRVRCNERPRVSIISTGDEIIPPASTPAVGQIRDSNSFLLAGMISEAGCIPRKKGIFRDDYDLIRAAVEKSMEDSDAILLSGGTSVGAKDLVARIIDDIGSPGVVFHGVTLKPGRPMIGGVMKGIPVFGLPGHPAAVSVCFEVFVRPLLERLSGAEEMPLYRQGRTVKARLDRNVASSPGREDHIRASIDLRDDGLWAVPVLGKSGLISTLVKADGTFVIPLRAAGVERGEVVEVRLF